VNSWKLQLKHVSAPFLETVNVVSAPLNIPP
jgi:hypothetical protein